MEVYTCANCDGTFENGWSDEESLAEYAANFPDAPASETSIIVCNGCYDHIVEFYLNDLLDKTDHQFTSA